MGEWLRYSNVGKIIPDFTVIYKIQFVFSRICNLITISKSVGGKNTDFLSPIFLALLNM